VRSLVVVELVSRFIFSIGGYDDCGADLNCSNKEIISDGLDLAIVSADKRGHL